MMGSLTPIVWADTFQEGLEAYREGEYERAFNIFLPFAEQGDAAAQYNLGLMYDVGTGVPQDYKKALIWYTKAAEQGYVWAQYNLGLMYAEGKGVPEDYKQALIWYTKAAEQG